MTIPATMRYVAHRDGGPELLSIATGPTPLPREDEVLIRVRAIGVNRPDVLQRSGLYPPPPGANPVLGLECAGEVAASGTAVSAFKPGDKVTALANGGAYAEYCAVPAAQCLPWPKGVDAVTAASLPETFFTVWANVFMMGHLAAGESFLVHGGTSGIGVTALLLAREFGATTYATAGSDEKVAACLKLGAKAAINYRTQDFAEEIRALTGKRGVDVILDMVGAPYFARNLRSLALEGRLVQIAFLMGSKVEQVDLMPVMLRRLTFTGSTMRARSTAQKAAIAAQLRERVWPVLDAGRCLPPIHATFAFEDVAEAHRLMESSAHIGKIMLSLDR
jgi:NADPH2:quinone reductase